MGAVAQLTKHERFQRLSELSEGDVQLPKLFRQTVPVSAQQWGWQNWSLNWLRDY